MYGDIGLTLKPGENLAGALHRMGLCQRIWLVPDNTGAYALTLIVPGRDVLGTGEYGNVAQLTAGRASIRSSVPPTSWTAGAMRSP